MALGCTGSIPVEGTIASPNPSQPFRNLNMNKEIEYFKRFSKAYLRYVNFDYDIIVSDAVKRQERIKVKEDEVKRLNTPTMIMMRNVFKASAESFNKSIKEFTDDKNFMFGAQWNKNAKIGQTLRIKTFPMEPSPPASVWARLSLFLKGRFS